MVRVSIDEEIAGLEREAALEITEPLLIRLSSARARAQLPGLIEPLSTLQGWKAAHEVRQDIAIGEVARRLSSRFDQLETREWVAECKNGMEGCVLCDGKGVIGDARAFAIWGNSEGHDPADHVGMCQKCKGMGSFPGPSVRHRLGLFRHKTTGLEFSLIPGRQQGCYACGVRGAVYEHADDCQEDSGCTGSGYKMEDCDGSFQPCGVHCDRIEPYLIARTPLTELQLKRDEWRRDLYEFSDVKGSSRKGWDIPVYDFSIGSAVEYLNGIGIRLPLEKEWRHGLRGGTETFFYWGDEFDGSHCWYAGNSGRAHTIRAIDGSPINALPPRPHSPAEHDKGGKRNAFGLVDMLGNVWELMGDIEPDETGSGNGCEIIMGGSFFSRQETIESNIQGRHRLMDIANETGYMNTVGFRPAASIPEAVR